MKFSGFPALAFVILALSGCDERTPQLSDYGVVPAFQMTDSSGHEFSSARLKRQVWIVDFIYTNCPAECPRMTSQMHKVAEQLRADEAVKLISISVDPARDTPPVLDAFAHRFGGPTPQWIFLTGSPETVHLLAYRTFHVGDLISKMDHSTKFALVDGAGHIRGYYSSFDSDSVKQMVHDASALERASA